MMAMCVTCIGSSNGSSIDIEILLHGAIRGKTSPGNVEGEILFTHYWTNSIGGSDSA